MNDQDSQPSGAPRVGQRRAAEQAEPAARGAEPAASRPNGAGWRGDRTTEEDVEPRRPAMTFRGAPVTTFLIVSMVAIELLLVLSPGLRDWALERFAFAILVESGEIYATWSWPILTHSALHAGLLHLGFNMAALAIFGPPVERSMGSLPYVFVYLLAAMAGAVTHFGWLAALAAFEVSPGAPLTVLVGASGAISGLLALEFWRRSLILRMTPPELRASPPGAYLRMASASFILINVAISLLPGFISGQAHIGGFLAGLVLAPLLLRRPRD